LSARPAGVDRSAGDARLLMSVELAAGAPRAAPPPAHARTALALVVALVAFAWLALAGWSASPWRRWLDHGAWSDLAWLASLCRALPAGEILVPTLAYAAAWVLMITAMMLPTTLPLLAMFRRIVASRDDAGTLMAAVVGGYASAWLGFGAVAYGIDAAVRGVATSGWLLANAWVVGSAVIGIAGAFQFSALKYRCLERCRSPFGFINARWRGRRPMAESFRLGAEHGLFCVGCCWALMLVTFVVGMGNVGWMLLLAAAMAAEKNLRWGARLRTPVGVALLAWAAAIAVAHG
jgi:predicted metal-binding membrane protein